MKPMTIVFVVDIFPAISETFILNQITGMLDMGHRVYIFSAARSDEHRYHDDVRKYDLLKKTYYHHEKPGNKIKRVLWALAMVFAYGHRNPKAILNSLNFFKYGKEALSLNYLYKVMLFLGIEKTDIIFCHFGPNGNFGALMRELGIQAKLMAMFHGYDIRRGITAPGVYRPLFKQADALLSISQYNYRHLVEFGAPVEKIRHHPVGIDTRRYMSINPKTAGQGPVKILSVCRLVVEKGLKYGIDAIHQLAAKRGITQIDYTIIGDGPLREELEAYVHGLGLKDQIHFLGYQIQEGVEKLLGQSHVFLLPSLAEALPVVLMEAQAAGLPVVGTKVGSSDEVVKDGISGFLVPPGDAGALAEKLEYLIQNPQTWESMGQAGRRHIQENYDIKKLNKSLDDLCREVLHQ